ncbi:MAG: GGDEF domain-containing protein [Terracidiphilus sp.]
MISIKKYLDSNSEEFGKRSEQVSRDSFAVALDAYGSALFEMGNCSLDACPGTGDSLKNALVRLRAELTPAIGQERLAATGEEAREKLQGWGRDTARHYQGKAREVKEILLTMARTAESVSARDQRCAGQMNAVTQRLKTIATLDDLTQIRASIVESATELKASIERMAEEGKKVLDHLRKQVEDYQAKLEEAEKIASRDALTGISNRVYVEGRLEEWIASETDFCVAIVDLDGFKKVNDEHGHLTGDELLKQFAGELRSACRSTDIIGRWGGDEFILLLDSGMEEAQAQIERVRKWVCGNYEVKGTAGTLKLRVNASIGMAAHAADETMKDLLARADAAMYEQKASSRSKAA